MTYSFNVRGVDPAAAKAAVAAKLVEVVAQVSCHVHDQALVQAVANAYIDLLPHTPDREISVTVGGFLSGRFADGEVVHIGGANVSVGVALVSPLAAQAALAAA